MRKLILLLFFISFSIAYSQFNTVYSSNFKQANYEVKTEINTGNIFLDTRKEKSKEIPADKSAEKSKIPKKEKKESPKKEEIKNESDLDYDLDEEIIEEKTVPKTKEKLIFSDHNLNEKVSYKTFSLLKENAPKKTYTKQLISMPLDQMYVTSEYGTRTHPVHNTVKMHQGIDLRASYVNVYSVMGGYVLEAGYTSKNGNYVAVEHNGFTTYYLHLSNIVVAKNQKIYAGQILGISGNTGTSTAPHLHFAVKENGTFVNPRQFLNDLILANNTYSTYYGDNRQISTRRLN